jgi:hypothetical protein
MTLLLIPPELIAVFKPLACAARQLHLRALAQHWYFALLLLGRE